MRTRTAAAVAGALGLAGLGIGLAGPAIAEAAPAAIALAGATTDDAATRLADRVARIGEALAGLVEDGTLSQEQADAVADTLASSDALRGPEGHGGRGGPGGVGGLLDDAASALGMTEDEVRDGLADGSTLADLAEAQGVAVTELVDALVGAATSNVEERVAAGDLTQERADDILADLESRITEMVESGGRLGGGGPMGGRGMMGDRSGSSEGELSTPSSADAS